MKTRPKEEGWKKKKKNQLQQSTLKKLIKVWTMFSLLTVGSLQKIFIHYYCNSETAMKKLH